MPGKEVQHLGPVNGPMAGGCGGETGFDCAKAEAGLEYCFGFCDICGICQLFNTYNLS